MSKIPTAADEAKFWTLVESAWQGVGDEANALRARLRETPDHEAAEQMWPHLRSFLDRLGELSADLSSADLADLDRVVERKLHDLDREDLHDVTDGSDDGFLYHRGLIVALGEEYYAAVSTDPSRATPDVDCEEMCYFFAHLYAARNDDRFPDTGSGISRESFSNKDGWSD